MCSHPIGTGPFKFAVLSPTNTFGWRRTPLLKTGRPYLDAIEWTIIPNRSTQAHAFVAGKFDMTFAYEITVQMVHDIKAQAPPAICEVTPTPVAINMLANRDARRSTTQRSVERCS
jgi:peptide/nickel transport system substrate-binding protein